MFNRKSLYALNKKDPNAIVYPDADGNLIRLTRDDFASEEEFLRWKKLSDADYHGEEKRDHKHSDYVISLEGLSEEAVAAPSVEEDYIILINNAERAVLRQALLDGLETHLSETQRRRLWKHLADGLSTYQIAEAEKVSHQSVLESIASAKKKFFRFFDKNTLLKP